MTSTSEPRTSTRLPRALAPFAHRAYRRLVLSLLLSVFGAGVWVVALVWEVIRLDGGPTQLSLVTTAAGLGLVLPSLLGGVVADRVPQQRILLVVATAEAVVLTAAAVLSAVDLMGLGVLALLAFCSGATLAFYYPAYSALLPSILPAEDLLAANGIEGMSRPLLQQAAGPAVAGAVVGWATAGAAMGVAAGVAWGAALAMLAVPHHPLRRDPEAAPTSALADVREGFAYMVRTPWLLSTLVFACVMTLVVLGPLEVLVPFLVKDRLGGDAGDHALVLAGFGIGAAVGSILTASLPMPRRYLTAMNLGWGCSCLFFLGMAFAQDLWVVVVSAAFLGALFGAPMVIWGTLLQRRVPPHLLGRVSSLDFFVSTCLLPVSMALAGPVAEAIGMTTTFVVAALVPIGGAVLAIWLPRLDRDELAHPLREPAAGAEPVAGR